MPLKPGETEWFAPRPESKTIPDAKDLIRSGVQASARRVNGVPGFLK